MGLDSSRTGTAQHSNKACHTDLVTRHHQTNYGLLLVQLVQLVQCLDINQTMFEITSTTPQTEIHISVDEGRGLGSGCGGGGGGGGQSNHSTQASPHHQKQYGCRTPT